jgi:hypothetical protein
VESPGAVCGNVPRGPRVSEIGRWNAAVGRSASLPQMSADPEKPANVTPPQASNAARQFPRSVRPQSHQIPHQMGQLPLIHPGG